MSNLSINFIFRFFNLPVARRRLPHNSRHLLRLHHVERARARRRAAPPPPEAADDRRARHGAHAAREDSVASKLFDQGHDPLLQALQPDAQISPCFA